MCGFVIASFKLYYMESDSALPWRKNPTLFWSGLPEWQCSITIIFHGRFHTKHGGLRTDWFSLLERSVCGLRMWTERLPPSANSYYPPYLLCCCAITHGYFPIDNRVFSNSWWIICISSHSDSPPLSSSTRGAAWKAPVVSQQSF